MTREDIIQMAREAGCEMDDSLVLEPEVIWYISQETLERFAQLVAAQEREACAKVVDEWNTAITDKIAAEIRARGKPDDLPHNITSG